MAQNSASSCYCVPVDFQHFNGLPEAMVMVLNKSLSLAIHTTSWLLCRAIFLILTPDHLAYLPSPGPDEKRIPWNL